MTSPYESILVLGASALGSPILVALADSSSRGPASVTLGLRDPLSDESAAFLKEHRISLLPIDIVSTSYDQLVSVISGYNTLIQCTGADLPCGTHLKVAQAATASSILRYFPWQYGVDCEALVGSSRQYLFIEQMLVRQLLRGQDKIKWAAVSPGPYADFLLCPKDGLGIIEKQGDRVIVRSLGGWDNKVTITKQHDMAKVMEALVYRDKSAQGVIYISGQTVTNTEIAEAVERAVGKSNVSREEWSAEFLEEEFRKDAGHWIKTLRAIFAEGVGMAWDEACTWNKQQGLELARLDQCVKEFVV